MTQCTAVPIGHAQHGGLGQKRIGPGGMPRKQATQARAVGQPRKPCVVVRADPIGERTLTAALERKDERQGHNLAGMQARLRVLRQIAQVAIHATKQSRDKIIGKHAESRLECGERP